MDYSFEEDMFIREKLKSLYIPVPEGFDEFINAKIKEGMALSEKKEKKRRHLSKGMIAVLVAIMILAIGVTVTASMDYYHKRMSMLSDQELEELLKVVDSSNAEVFSYSRPLSEEEKKRTVELREKYISEGLYPEKDHKIINSLDEIRKDEVSFYAPKSFYYIPDRPLTDEELLEMIDYLFKADYALGKRAEEQVSKIETLPEKELIGITKNFVEKFFDIKLTDYSSSVKKQLSTLAIEEDEIDLDITLRDQNSSFECTTTINGRNGRVLLIKTPKTVHKDSPYKDSECIRIARELKEKALMGYESKVKIDKIFVYTELNAPTVIDGGTIGIVYMLNNGESVELVYSVDLNRVLEYGAGYPQYYITNIEEYEIEKCKKNNFEYIKMEVKDE